MPAIPTLEDAIKLAVEAHAGQTDKHGKPYILHPLRVMFRMRTDEEMLVAILHDVVEDSDITIKALQKMRYPRHVLAAVDALTRRNGESYDRFVARIRRNPLAVAVKIGDLEDHMDIRRYTKVEPKHIPKLRQVLSYWHALSNERNKRSPKRRK